MWMFALTLAGAAEVTWMPEALEGSATLRYSGRIERGALVEAGERVAGRRLREHRIELSAEFAPVRGLALNVGLVTVPSWAWTYVDARPMQIEPVGGGGTYAHGAPSDTPIGVAGGGVEGLWFGAAVAPFSETYAQGHQGSWRLDAGVRTGARSRWGVEDGRRGGGPGGTALRASGAFSRRIGPADAHLRAAWQREGRAQIPSAQGPLTIRPSTQVELRAGVELVAGEGGPVRWAIDAHGGASYRSPEQVPSGLLLPSSLFEGALVTHAAGLTAFGGLGLHTRVRHNARISAGLRLDHLQPHAQEHVAPVHTSGSTFALGWTLALTGVLGADDVRGPPP